jgi:hypothetical protein
MLVYKVSVCLTRSSYIGVSYVSVVDLLEALCAAGALRRVGGDAIGVVF